jgi:hypothetical protein
MTSAMDEALEAAVCCESLILMLHQKEKPPAIRWEASHQIQTDISNI